MTKINLAVTSIGGYGYLSSYDSSNFQIGKYSNQYLNSNLYINSNFSNKKILSLHTTITIIII